MYKSIVLWLLSILRITEEQYQYLGGFSQDVYIKEEWKSIVVIEFDFTHVCSGSVISKDYVLTAAHCVDKNFSNNLPFRNSNLTCRVGGFINQLADSVIPVERVYYHPHYNLTAGIADIALLKLKFPVRTGVKNIRLPSAQLSYGSHCHLVGWKDLEYDGNITSKIASIVPLPVRAIFVTEQALMDLSACEDALREINYEVYNEIMSSKVNIISQTSICTKSKEEDENKFNDSFTDSGGPVLCDDELHGIQSFMLEMKDGRTFFISTRVDKYMFWITNITYKDKSDDSSLPQILTEEDLAKEKQLKSMREGMSKYKIALEQDLGNISHGYRLTAENSTDSGSFVSRISNVKWTFVFVTVLFTYYIFHK